MKVQDDPSDPKRGGCIPFLVMIVFLVIFVVVIGNMVFGNSYNLPNIRFTKIKTIFPVFLMLLAFNITWAILGFVVARRNQWKPILWLNKRLFSTVEKKRNVKPKSNGFFRKFNDRFNPERLLELKEQQDIPYGCYVSEPGEEFMSPDHPFFYKSWMANTVYSTILWSIRNILFITMITSVLVIINTYFLILGCLLSLGFFFSMMLFYWGKEWERFTEVFFVTTHRFGYVKGQFSWSGLLFGAGVDISFEEYDFEFLGPTNVDPVPDYIKHPKIKEFLLETLAKGEEKVGTLKIRIIGSNGPDKDLILFDFSYAPLINTLINMAKKKNREIVSFNAALEGKAMQHTIGRPGQQVDVDNRKEEIQEWEGQFKGNPSKLIDIFHLVRERINKMSTAEDAPDVTAVETTESRETNNTKGEEKETDETFDPNIFPGE